MPYNLARKIPLRTYRYSRCRCRCRKCASSDFEIASIRNYITKQIPLSEYVRYIRYITVVIKYYISISSFSIAPAYTLYYTAVVVLLSIVQYQVRCQYKVRRYSYSQIADCLQSKVIVSIDNETIYNNSSDRLIQRQVYQELYIGQKVTIQH